MIITRFVNIKVTSPIRIKLKEIGIDSEYGDKIKLPIEKLWKNSHIQILVKCDNCGKEKYMRFQYYNRFTNNNEEKYYCNEKDCINKKRESSLQKKYGVDNVFQLDNIKEKIKKTNLKKYGVENPQQNKEIKNKTTETNINKYGVENPFQSKQIKEKIKRTNLKKYGVEYPQQSIIIRNKYSSLHKSSSLENEVFSFIKDYTKDVIKSKKIEGYELDIYIPELNLSFEFNGLYWHSELYKDKNYHLNKTELCEKNGIQLIHIYEDDWVFRNEITKSIILNKLKKTPNKIYARKTEIKEIDNNKLIREFLEKNHIQGFVGSNVKLGLFYKNELVSLMTFGKRRVAMGKKKSEDGECELLRFCSKLNTNVVGGANKLFKYFVKEHEPKTIITYADRSRSDGNLYKKLGFEYEGKTEPNYYYIIDRKRKYRFGFRKNILVKDGYDPNKTEHQIMLSRKIYRIYDSGNLKFKFNN